MPKILNVSQKYRSKEWLYQKYIIEQLPSRAIADIVGASRKTIDQWLAKAKIKKRGFGGSRDKKSKKWLINEYTKKNKSLREIAKEINEDFKTVHRWIIEYNITPRKVGDPRKREDSPWWTGGKYKSKKGYTWIYVPEHPNCNSRGYVMEHRLVVENQLKRYLKKEEIVHHINFIREDSRLKNLYLFSSQSEHAKYHKLYILKKAKKLKSNLYE